jgi:hypothetical protein
MPYRKNVSFDHKVRTRSVLSIGDLSSEERMNSWYSRADFNNIRRRERRLTRKISEIGSLRESLGHEIGIETKADKLERRARIQNGSDSVLLEQERQWDSESPNAERLALASSNVSQESLSMARGRALSVAEQLQNSPMASKGSIMNLVIAYKLDPYSDAANGNQRWRVAARESETFAPPPRDRSNKHNFRKISGMIPPVRK